MIDQTFINKYGPWALVTGASDGIGRALAVEIAKRGLNVVIIARRREELEFLSQELKRDFNVSVRILNTDVTSEEAIASTIVATADLDIGLVVAAAGFGTSGPLIESDLKTALNMIDVNCRAVLQMTHHFAKNFAQRRRGGLILMSSLVAFQGVPFACNYAATKAYIQSLAEGLAIELKPLGVDVIASAPGPVASGFAARAHMKMGSAATPQAIARGTLAALGRTTTVRPGFLSKFLGWSLGTMNRWGRVRAMQRIMGRMAQGGGK